MKRDERNLSMLTDFYELTMMNGYLEKGMGDTVAVFDVFFRTIPDNGGFAIFAGLEQLIDYLKNLSFTEEDIDYVVEKLKGIVARLRELSPVNGAEGW